VSSKSVSKTKRKLSCADFEALLRLAETATLTVGAPELLRLFPASAQNLLATGAFLEEPHALTIVPVGDDCEKSVEWNDDLGSYAYFSTRGWIKVEPDRLRRYKLNVPWLVDQILQALSWPQKTVMLLDGLLWDCGPSYIGKNQATIFVCRRIAHPAIFNDIASRLSPRCRNGGNVLLTTTPSFPSNLSIPGLTIMTLVEALDRRRQHFTLDADLIANTVFGRRPEEKNRIVLCKANGGILIINGRSFKFRGDKQRQVVQHLCGKYDAGELPVRIQQMFSDLEFPDKTRMQDLFKKHPDWKEAIRVTRGDCNLITPA